MIKLKTEESMLRSASFNPPLVNVFHSNSTLLNKTMLVLLGVLVMIGASQLSIPFKPVPLTFQSTTAILIGMAYGSRLGTSVILSYLAAGALGLPVFADLPTGLARFAGPTGGYLIGFVPAVFVSGYLAEKGFARTVAGSFVAASVGTSIIFFCGVAFLSRFIGWQGAMLFGLAPFIFSETIKLVAVSFLVPKCWKK